MKKYDLVIGPIGRRIEISNTVGMNYAFDKFNVKKQVRGDPTFRIELVMRFGVEVDDS